jgi:aerobic carbon-monoxide dehydrogenase small subunit
MDQLLHGESIAVSFTLNGAPVSLQVEAQTRLSTVLREELSLTGTKLACSIGRCGACSVLLDGRAMNACLAFAWQMEGRDVVTIEGIDALPVAAQVKAGLLEESSFQCGYCAPGFVIALVSLLGERPMASDEDVIAGLEGNICRCTGYQSIVRGALNAAARVREGQDG